MSGRSLIMNAQSSEALQKQTRKCPVLMVISHQAATFNSTMEQGLLVRECMNDFGGKRDTSNILHIRLIDLFIESAVNYIGYDIEKNQEGYCQCLHTSRSGFGNDNARI